MTSFLDKAVPILSKEDLEKLHTGSLLSRLQKLRALEESESSSDWLASELPSAEEFVLFKETDAWRTAYDDLKSVLDAREHIPRGGKEKRREQAFKRKHR
ncbi:hypothetical protein [Cohaesibacter gelatinilyticus]|uniref:Uncharacterized protein n=1 Tax=Cohaesibacter gelatinilyticus TaxID=372072 RepID=A0A285PDS1_9HYPH|nr:hypothetical protein [Cohaesibacter gelatinilyticus]SNZ19383.1 hypothetical protein SAMN06265368_2468 [Cohaesibacter gelatinilyticus]